MRVLLKRIKREKFDEVKHAVLEQFEATGNIELHDEVLEGSSETVLVEGKTAEFDYSIEKYLQIVHDAIPTYKKLAQIGMLLHEESRDVNGKEIPRNVLYEPEVWAYLSFRVFSDVVKKLRLDGSGRMTADKIERFYFNVKTRSRTGLLFVWSMVDMLECENDREFAEVAFHFIDPVKAVYERTMARNPMVLRAFVQAIIDNNQDARIKNQKYKSKIPSNISCFARVNIVDAYEYEDLVAVISDKIREVLLIA